MDIQIIEHIKETLSVVIQCNKIDDEVMRLKSHIESFDNKLYAFNNPKRFFLGSILPTLNINFLGKSKLTFKSS